MTTAPQRKTASSSMVPPCATAPPNASEPSGAGAASHRSTRETSSVLMCSPRKISPAAGEARSGSSVAKSRRALPGQILPSHGLSSSRGAQLLLHAGRRGPGAVDELPRPCGSTARMAGARTGKWAAEHQAVRPALGELGHERLQVAPGDALHDLAVGPALPPRDEQLRGSGGQARSAGPGWRTGGLAHGVARGDDRDAPARALQAARASVDETPTTGRPIGRGWPRQGHGRGRVAGHHSFTPRSTSNAVVCRA